MAQGTQTPLLVELLPIEGGLTDVRSPAVGWWLDPPRAGELVGPGSRIGTLRRLRRTFPLALPQGAAGRVEGVPHERIVAVGFGQSLFHLEPLHAAEPAERGVSRRAREAGSQAALPEGTWALVAPTDGVFYRRPAPEAAPFVEPGSRLRRGQPVGLVEVMKTFNQILYGGPDLPEEVEVIEIRCADVEEVGAGQILMLVR